MFSIRADRARDYAGRVLMPVKLSKVTLESNGDQEMLRAIACVVLVLGIFTVGLSSVSYLRLQQFAINASPIDLLDQVDVRLMTIGMRKDLSSNMIDAADFARQLQDRFYIVFGAGLALLLSGAVLLLLSRRNQHEHRAEHRAEASVSPIV